MSTSSVSIISGGQKVRLFELDGLTVQALSALRYQGLKQGKLPYRVNVFTEGTYSTFEMLPQLPFIFESQEQFDTVQLQEMVETLQKHVGPRGLLTFDKTGQVVPPPPATRRVAVSF